MYGSTRIPLCRLCLMKNDKVVQLEKVKPRPKGLVLKPVEKKRLVDFFALLIEIDRRENVTNTYDKTTK